MDDHQRYLNSWGMFDHWPHPWVEMVEAREQVAAALGAASVLGFDAFESDDGSVRWGAATATAYAVLASGYLMWSVPALRAAWEQVIDVTEGSA